MIVYDLQALQSRAHADRGIARYTCELARAITKLDPARIDCFSINPVLGVPSSIYGFADTHRIVRSDQLKGKKVSLLHITSPVELDRPIEQMLTGRPDKLIVNLYDLIPAIFPERYLKDAGTASRYWSRLGLYSSADAILSDSQSAVDDVVRILGVSPGRCTVIGAGTGPEFIPWDGRGRAPIDRIRAALPQVRSGFILAPSGMDWRKNFVALLEAFSFLPKSLRQHHQLVLMCKVTEHEQRHLEEQCSRMDIEADVLVTGYVSDDVLVALQQTAALVVFPSLYEGFGLPVLEARRCGAPVICGDNSSLREILPAFARFDASSTGAIAAAMTRPLVDATFRKSLVEIALPDLSWEVAAERTLAVYDQVLGSSAVASRRPHLAYVSPLPPIESGIADYTYRLVTALAKQIRVTCFVDQSPHDVHTPPGVQVRPLSDLSTLYAAGYYDKIVVALGNNEWHASSVAVLHQLPAAAHLHDLRLVNCYTTSDWPAIVARHYPGRYFDFQLRSFDGPSAPAVYSQGVLLLSDVARSATELLVHSSFAATMVELDTGGLATNIGPLAMPTDVTRDVELDDVGPYVVASFGILSPLKQSEKVIVAGEILTEDPQVTVALVGLGPQSGVQGPGGRIVFPGRQSGPDFAAWMRRTTVAIQLRDSSNGESSAALGECLAFGIPTIVTDLGSMSELPDDVVVKVPREISAGDLAALVRGLLDSPIRRSSLSLAAQLFARENSFDVVATRLLIALGLQVPESDRSPELTVSLS